MWLRLTVGGVQLNLIHFVALLSHLGIVVSHQPLHYSCVFHLGRAVTVHATDSRRYLGLTTTLLLASLRNGVGVMKRRLALTRRL